MTLGEKIKRLREAKGMTQSELAERIGYKHKSSVNKLELGINDVTASKLKEIADVFNVNPADLVTDVEPTSQQFIDLHNYGVRPISVRSYPLYGEIACGKPKFANEDRESYVLAGTEIKADFCLKANGDSMINARIYDGDIVFIRSQNHVDNGEIAAVIIDDEATLKRVYYYPEKNTLILKAENPKYEDLIYIGEELNHITIIGKAVAFQSDVI